MKLKLSQLKKLIREVIEETPNESNTGYVTYNYDSDTADATLTFQGSTYRFNKSVLDDEEVESGKDIDSLVLKELRKYIMMLRPDLRFVEDEDLNPGEPVPVAEYCNN